ncbi:3-isopropylmalate dehydratase small subunit [Myxococcota bacterium]|nr:3-isopropylmalate dehydratase small subunit [Myxococcota bacterium]
MAGESISRISGKGVYVQGNDIDTDRIIPARFLKCVTFDELGPSLFHDERFTESGESKNHVLDAPQHRGAAVLISDDNFGCGSSREHAPQAIQKFGLKAVIAGSFAEIFHGNCTTLGIPCVIASDEDRKELSKIIENDPEASLDIDIEKREIVCANKVFQVSMKESAREAFLAATFDPLDELLGATEEIKAAAERLGYA